MLQLLNNQRSEYMSPQVLHESCRGSELSGQSCQVSQTFLTFTIYRRKSKCNRQTATALAEFTGKYVMINTVNKTWFKDLVNILNWHSMLSCIYLNQTAIYCTTAVQSMQRAQWIQDNFTEKWLAPSCSSFSSWRLFCSLGRRLALNSPPHPGPTHLSEESCCPLQRS